MGGRGRYQVFGTTSMQPNPKLFVGQSHSEQHRASQQCATPGRPAGRLIGQHRRSATWVGPQPPVWSGRLVDATGSLSC